MPRNLGQRLGDTVVNAGTVRTLLGSGTVLVAALWPDRYTAYTTLPAPGAGDPYAIERELLGLADSITPRRSASISASIMRRPETVAMLEATGSSLIPASCSTAPSRWISEVRCCTTLVR